MDTNSSLRTTAVAAVGAALLAQAAFAGGESKNQQPFTRHANDHAFKATTTTDPPAAIHGEPKNQLPFTRVVTTR